MARAKISLIGGGQIGGNLALLAAQKELGDIVIFDIPKAEGMVKGKALDILESNPHDGYDVNITGSSKLSDIKNADVVAITAGVPRKPGMSREDLLEININIISEIAINVKKYSPNAFVIVVSIFSCWINDLIRLLIIWSSWAGEPPSLFPLVGLGIRIVSRVKIWTGW